MPRTFSASAPGRAGIVGNPSDIYGGTVVSCSVPARANCRLTLGAGSRLPEDTRLWDAALRRFPLDGPVEVDWTTSVPRSSGLSGSTALLAATLLCVLAARDEAPELRTTEDRTAFAELVRDVERHDAGIMCGYQDAYMISHGGLNLMRFPGKHPVNPGPRASVAPLDLPLPFLLVTTGVERLSGSVHGPMAERWMAGEPAVTEGIGRIAELGEAGGQAIQREDWGLLAELMDENHRIVAGLGGSGEPIDRLIDQCKRHGALAAKLAGAGLGGTVIALTHDPDELQARLSQEGYARFLRPERVVGAILSA